MDVLSDLSFVICPLCRKRKGICISACICFSVFCQSLHCTEPKLSVNHCIVHRAEAVRLADLSKLKLCRIGQGFADVSFAVALMFMSLFYILMSSVSDVVAVLMSLVTSWTFVDSLGLFCIVLCFVLCLFCCWSFCTKVLV